MIRPEHIWLIIDPIDMRSVTVQPSHSDLRSRMR